MLTPPAIRQCFPYFTDSITITFLPSLEVANVNLSLSSSISIFNHHDCLYIISRHVETDDFIPVHVLHRVHIDSHLQSSSLSPSTTSTSVYMCECSIGVHVRDGTTIFLISIVVHVVMGCIAVLGRQMNVDFSISDCKNTIPFVGMDVCFCTPRTSTTLNSLTPG